jgi:hypothetical protein
MRSIFFVLFLFTTSNSWANPTDINSIKTTVQKWNDLHNSKQIDQFWQLYGPSVLFYGRYSSAEKCVENKRTFLKAAHQQEIITPITISFYSSGTIKCTFTKRVTYKKRAKEYPSYLLLEQNGDRYTVTGESDLITDQNLGVQLNIGEEIIEQPASNSTTSILIIIALSVILLGVIIYARNQKRIQVDVAEIEPLEFDDRKNLSNINVTEEVEKAQTLPRIETHEEETPGFKTTSSSARLVSEDVDKGREFEKYVVERFSKEHYALLEWRGDKFHEGRYAQSNMYPDLELRLETKRYNVTFAIECKWRKDFYCSRIDWAKNYQLNNYRKYQYQSGNPVFVVIGVGGEPSNPAATYVVPLDHIETTSLHENKLKNYYPHKKGNFFLHAEAMVLE